MSMLPDWQDDESRLVLGTGSAGLHGQAEAFALFDAYLDHGGRTLDTAAVYSDWVPGERGRSETTIGAWFAQSGKRDQVRLVTKGGHPPLDDLQHGRLDPASLRQDVETSLSRLRTEHIDLYLLHRDDRSRPVAEIMAVLQTFVAEGKIGAIGLSNWDPDRLAEACAVSGPRPVATQVLGNVLLPGMTPPVDTTTRALTAQAMAQAKADDLAIMLFTSQAQGALTKALAGHKLPRDYDNPACRAVIQDLLALAARHVLEPTVMAVSYLLAVAPDIFPIVGAHSLEQLQVSMAADAGLLDAEMVAEIGAITGFSRLIGG